ncbi:ABC transporter permease [Bacillus arachidis]|uniref:Putative hemin transport system permease protein HrtB n=1 Tax=Bacillus arachidis TaxID=2819290 RepID=A0ABS3NVX3_9BACI|nr:ABC transporter permease [Bacillus arachidis]MBO1625030.1 ABC transporter permease [Bacillus arachidis]WIY59810.1 ABC transporter permease [Bacillus arachidis]
MFLALKELKQSKLRYGLIGTIMMLLSFLVLIISGLANGLSHANASSFIEMKADKFIVSDDVDGKLLRSQIKKEDVDKVLAQVDAKDAIPMHIKVATFEKEGNSNKVDVAIFSSKQDSFIAPKVIEGKNGTLENNEVVVDESIKQKGIKLGDELVEPISKKTFKVVGFSQNQMFSHSPVVHMNENAWDAIALPHQKDYSVIALNTDKKIDNAKVIDKKEVLQSIPGYKEEQGTLTMIIGFLLAISALLIGVFFYVITLQKTHQLGVLKAIGTKNSYLAKTLVVQSIFLTGVALIIGIGLIFAVEAILPASMPFLLTTTTILQYIGVFILISILGTLISLYQVLKVDALEAIGGGM